MFKISSGEKLLYLLKSNNKMRNFKCMIWRTANGLTIICNKYFKLLESRDHRRNLLGALDTRVRHSFKTPGTAHKMTQHHILKDPNSQKINC
jgi:hypothetical protein